jgi:hypothetical protein
VIPAGDGPACDGSRTDREAAGRITPEFFNRSGERTEIPLRYVEAVKAAVKGATTIDCHEAVLARAAVAR